MSTANLMGGLVALKDGKMISLRVPYPLGFYAKGFNLILSASAQVESWPKRDSRRQGPHRRARAKSANWKKYRSRSSRELPYSLPPKNASQRSSRARASSFNRRRQRGSSMVRSRSSSARSIAPSNRA